MFNSVFLIYDGDKQRQTYYLDRMLGLEDNIISFLVKNSNNELFILNIPNFIKDPQSNINLSSNSLSGWLYTNKYFIFPEKIKKSLTQEELTLKKIEPIIEYCHSAYIIPVELNQINFKYQIVQHENEEKKIIRKIKDFFRYLKKRFRYY